MLMIWPTVFNPSFISKVVERAATSQFHQYLATNKPSSTFQSAYRKNHTMTETAMQPLRRVWSDILMAADERLVTLLGQLDISAAFDSFDHFMLLGHLV